MEKVAIEHNKLRIAQKMFCKGICEFFKKLHMTFLPFPYQQIGLLVECLLKSYLCLGFSKMMSLASGAGVGLLILTASSSDEMNLSRHDLYVIHD